jgi:hypothetical protein
LARSSQLSLAFAIREWRMVWRGTHCYLSGYNLVAPKKPTAGSISEPWCLPRRIVMKIELFKEVSLTRDIPEHHLRAGDLATILEFVPHPSGGEDGCVLEVFNVVGKSIAVVTAPISAIEELTDNHGAHLDGVQDTRA